MLKIGHRGAKGYVAENTLASFQKALELDVDIIELDVHVSKDNIPVVIHDETVDRTTNAKGKVTNFTAKELQNLGIPILEEVFDLVLYYPAEKKLELVIFSLKEPRPSNPAWPTPTELVRQFLAERLQMRYPFEKLLLTTIKVSPQETKVSRKEASKELFALHWPEVVKSLAEMKELSEMPSHEEDGCRYCEAIESRMVRELNSDEETADAVQKEAAGETIPLSA